MDLVSLHRQKSEVFHLKMKTIILFGLLGATLSAPLLLSLNNAQLQPLQLQSPFNSWIPPFSGILQQQQAQIPGLSPFSLATLDQVARLFPNQITSPGQVSFAQGNQVGQLEPSQPQAPVQTHQGPNNAMPYVFSFKMPEEQAQMLQYYPVYMLLPWEQPQLTVPELPPQTGQQQFEEQMPFYTQFGYIPQQVKPVIPGGQKQLAFDAIIGTGPETAAMPAEGVIPYLQNKMINFKHASRGIVIPPTSQKPSTTNAFASAIDPTITPEPMEEKAKTSSLKEP